MTTYARISTVVDHSELSDYNPRETLAFVDEVQPGQVVLRVRVNALIGGTTVDLASFASVARLIVANRDDTNYVTATYTYSAAARVAKINKGSHIIVQEPTVANDLLLTANTASCECDVWAVGTPAV